MMHKEEIFAYFDKAIAALNEMNGHLGCIAEAMLEYDDDDIDGEELAQAESAALLVPGDVPASFAACG